MWGVRCSFEEHMENWDESTHNHLYKKLPYFGGTSNKGYFIKGFTYVDVVLYGKLSKVMWTVALGYLRMSLSRSNCERLGLLKEKGVRGYKILHKEVLLCKTGLQVDHINRLKKDNRRKNLREVTNAQNNVNKVGFSGRTSMYKGVSWKKGDFKDGCNWKCQIEIKGLPYFYGRFKTEEEAAKAYDLHISLHDKEGFILLNF